MGLLRQLCSEKLNRLNVYLYYLIYYLNDTFLKIRKLDQFLWQCLKRELFYIAGQCQHSGNCCRHIMIYSKSKPIQGLSEFETLKQSHPKYHRFVPQLDFKGHICHFDCSCLSKENKCNDYKNRPSFCRQYPESYFMTFDTVHKGCGFYIKAKIPHTKLMCLSLKKRINRVLILNHLEFDLCLYDK